jgi:hypothetical protein
MQVGLVRRVEVEPALWRDRFPDHDYRKSLLEALEVEAIGRLQTISRGTSVWDRASRADLLDIERIFLVRVRDAPVSDGPSEEIYESFVPKTPSSLGVIIASISLTNLANARRKVDRLVIDTELSDRILEARMLKGKREGWPVEIADIGSSQLGDGHWNYALRTDGTFEMFFSRQVCWDDDHGLTLPVRYQSSRHL